MPPMTVSTILLAHHLQKDLAIHNKELTKSFTGMEPL
jgi:hypothetical protein